MRKKFLFLSFLLLISGLVSAQPVGTIAQHGCVSISMMGGNVHHFIGQPFYQQYDGANSHIAESFANAYVSTANIDTNLRAPHTLVVNGHTYGQAPYDVFNTTYLDTAYDASITGLYNYDTISYYSILYLPSCDASVVDVDGNTYDIIFLGNRCWTKTNFRSTKNNSSADIEVARTFTTTDYNVDASNIEKYGLLYSINSAADIPETADISTAAVDANGHVQGICPVGYHIPTDEDWGALNIYEQDELRATDEWLQPGTNTTDFSVYPGGRYNPVTNQYERFKLDAYFWSLEKTTLVVHECHLSPLCNTFEYIPNTQKGTLFSLRCVKSF